MLKAEPHGHADEVILEVATKGDFVHPSAMELTFHLSPEASTELRRQLKRAETILANRRRVRAPRSR